MLCVEVGRRGAGVCGGCSCSAIHWHKEVCTQGKQKIHNRSPGAGEMCGMGEVDILR